MPKIVEIVETEPQIRRRNKLSGHTTAVSNIVIYGYGQLSDAAKMTYIALESYDWPDENGQSKGKAWPSIGRLAADRGKSYDSICRHLKELNAAGLIGIESGKQLGRSNVYWLEEPASAEVEAYQQRCQRNSQPGAMHTGYYNDAPTKVPAPVLTETVAIPTPITTSHPKTVVNTQTPKPYNAVANPMAFYNSKADQFGLAVESDLGCEKMVDVQQICPTHSRSFAVRGGANLLDKGIQLNQKKANQEKDDSNRVMSLVWVGKADAGMAVRERKDSCASEYSANKDTDNELDINKHIGNSLRQTEPHHSKPPTQKKYDNEQGTSKKNAQPQSWGQTGQGKVYSSSYVSQVMQDFSLALHDTEHTRPNQSQANKLYQQAAGQGLSEKKFVELMYEAKKRAQWAALADSTSSPEGPNRAAYFFTTLRGLLVDSIQPAAHS